MICADDYALTPSICEAIIELADLGRISATSVMTLSPFWPAWAQRAERMQTCIDVGLHLDFTSDFAVEQGYGTTLGQLMVSSMLRTLSPVKVKEQILHQLDLFEQHAGSEPDHIDGHQHVQQFPVIREALIETLVKRYPSNRRPWIRVSRLLTSQWELKKQIINAMGANSLLILSQRFGVAHSHALSGSYDFSGDTYCYWLRLNDWIKTIPTGTVLMCHPSTDHDTVAPFAKARYQELKVLRESDLQNLLDLRGVRIVRGKLLFKTPTVRPLMQQKL